MVLEADFVCPSVRADLDGLRGGVADIPGMRETKAPEGYILDETPKTVEVKTNVPTTVTFSNKPLSGIKIIKTDSFSGW